MSSSTRRPQQERDNEYSNNTQQQHEINIHSIDETKEKSTSPTLGKYNNTVG